jgi:hypothetical protein
MSSTQQLLLGEGAVNIIPNYIEEVFSTYLYTGNGSTQTITNGIDLSTKGGMVWLKSRSAATNNFLFDTVRGALNEINSNNTDAQASLANSLTAFNSTGFSLGSAAGINVNTATYASWTFREQPKFFDVVTYTGDGTTPRSIPHNLGSTPGCVMIKMLSTSADWYVYHRGLPTTTGTYIRLNSDGTTNANPVIFPASPVNSTAFKVGDGADVNGSGSTYVAYVFAHDAGGFGLTGTDNVITCGSYTTNNGAASAFTSLGYEPQWILSKQITDTGNWVITDNMRGLLGGPGTLSQNLFPNSTAGEADTGRTFEISQSGFKQNGGGTDGTVTCIYIAIRRGPMKVPTSGTSVFEPVTRTGTGADATVTTGITPVDMLWSFNTTGGIAQGEVIWDRLRGANRLLRTAGTAAETVTTNTVTSFAVQNGYIVGTDESGYGPNYSALPFVNYNFKRAPSFFDEVCYTGTGSNRTISHNLAAVPELMIVKRRNAAGAWEAYSATLAATQYMVVNTTAAVATGATRWNSTRPTASVFSLGTSATVNASAAYYVAYLFATCAGVSKVGTYTGTGTTLQVDCGFTAGSRFVLIKRTDSTGDWYVWDSARGIIAGNDPYLLLNSTAAEVTGTDYVDTYSAGFEISSTAPAAINASGGTFIFLAIA